MPGSKNSILCLKDSQLKIQETSVKRTLCEAHKGRIHFNSLCFFPANLGNTEGSYRIWSFSLFFQ